MQVTGSRPRIVAAADGRGVVGHAGARLLADLAGATGRAGAFSEALAPLRVRRSGHDPGRIAVDVEVMLADGGEAIAGLAVLRNQTDLFGAVASDPTAWRLLSDVDGAALTRLRHARAQAGELAWAQAAEARVGVPGAAAAGVPVPGDELDLAASPLICHAGKQAPTRTPPAPVLSTR